MSPKEPKVKPRKSVKIPAAQLNKLRQGLDVAEAVYSDLIAAWPTLTVEQRDSVLEHSPLLARLEALTAPLRSS